MVDDTVWLCGRNQCRAHLPRDMPHSSYSTKSGKVHLELIDPHWKLCETLFSAVVSSKLRDTSFHSPLAHQPYLY